MTKAVIIFAVTILSTLSCQAQTNPVTADQVESSPQSNVTDPISFLAQQITDDPLILHRKGIFIPDILPSNAPAEQVVSTILCHQSFTNLAASTRIVETRIVPVPYPPGLKSPSGFEAPATVTRLDSETETFLLVHQPHIEPYTRDFWWDLHLFAISSTPTSPAITQLTIPLQDQP